MERSSPDFRRAERQTGQPPPAPPLEQLGSRPQEPEAGCPPDSESRPSRHDLQNRQQGNRVNRPIDQPNPASRARTFYSPAPGSTGETDKQAQRPVPPPNGATRAWEAEDEATGAPSEEPDERSVAPFGADGATPVFDARAAWQKALGELQLQLAPSTYSTWLHETWVSAYEDGEFLIATANTYARDWLQHRLRAVVKRTLKHVVGRTVEVNFVVLARPSSDCPAGRMLEAAPLYRASAAEDAGAESSRGIQAAQPAAAALFGAAGRPERTARREGMGNGSSQLNPAHRFDTFVVGNHNRFAYAAAQAISEKPGYNFNPLFLYGGVGLGKTHLLHAVGNALEATGHAVLYCTSEQFTNELISAIRSQSQEQFRNKYRELDVLLIDDIQFIGGKESTQEEVFHTFNHLHSAGRQVVLSSDRPPKALTTLVERLRSRFEGGIQVDISQPDFETRVAILQLKAQRMGNQVSLEVLKLIAERVDSNIRELEGALNHLVLQAHITRTPLDVGMAVYALDHLAPERKPCSPPKVLELVGARYQLPVEELVGQRRTKNVADARHVAMYLLREELGLSLPQIGQLLGNRDHTTVAHAIEKVGREVGANDLLRRDLLALREQIYTPFIG
jgi:chromosomal replication initiator protein